MWLWFELGTRHLAVLLWLLCSMLVEIMLKIQFGFLFVWLCDRRTNLSYHWIFLLLIRGDSLSLSWVSMHAFKWNIISILAFVFFFFLCLIVSATHSSILVFFLALQRARSTWNNGFPLSGTADIYERSCLRINLRHAALASSNWEKKKLKKSKYGSKITKKRRRWIYYSIASRWGFACVGVWADDITLWEVKQQWKRVV